MISYIRRFHSTVLLCLLGSQLTTISAVELVTVQSLTVRVTGVVHDASGQPVSGASVAVHPPMGLADATTGVDGSYAISGTVSTPRLRVPDLTLHVHKKGIGAVDMAIPRVHGRLDPVLGKVGGSQQQSAAGEPRFGFFPDDRQGAFTPTFDDSKLTQMTVVKPLFDAFGYRCTFYLVTDSIDKGDMTWDQLRTAYQQGYEIGNHTSGHNLPNSPQTPEVEAAARQQIMGGYQAIAQHIGHPPLTFAFPGGSENEFTQGLVKQTPMIGWRGQWPCVSGSSEDLPLAAHIDCLDKAIAQAKDWRGIPLSCYVFYMHDVPADSRLASALGGMLSYAHVMDDVLWCAPYAAVTIYQTEREKTSLAVLGKSSESITIAISNTLDPEVYNLPLTIVVPMSRPISQAWVHREGDERKIEVKIRHDRILVNALPGDKPLTIAWTHTGEVQAEPPHVTMTAPLAKAAFSAPQAAELSASVTPNDAGVATVAFYDGGVKIGEDSTAPYSMTWTDYLPGRHVLCAVASDQYGVRTVSKPVVVACFPTVNKPPVATLQRIESRPYTVGETIEMVVSTENSDDEITMVEYYDGETMINRTGAGAMSWFGWKTDLLGQHSITAKVYDERGAMSLTAPCVITVVAKP